MELSRGIQARHPTKQIPKNIKTRKRKSRCFITKQDNKLFYTTLGGKWIKSASLLRKLYFTAWHKK
jgi:hypothetical protein